MSADAKSRWNSDRFDVRAFAQAGAQWGADEPLARFPRLVAELPGGVEADGLTVSWSARGEQRPGLRGGDPTIWLHVEVRVDLPLPCQRCLAPVAVPLAVDRWFRFVADEDTAAAEDEDSEEDVLALEPRPSLRDLIEDELLMELPPVPLHEVCPAPLPLHDSPGAPAEAQTEVSRRHPFAELARLKK